MLGYLLSPFVTQKTKIIQNRGEQFADEDSKIKRKKHRSPRSETYAERMPPPRPSLFLLQTTFMERKINTAFIIDITLCRTRSLQRS